MGERLAIGDRLAIDADALEFSFIRSPGPGGQNVNKVATAVQLRFDLMGAPELPAAMKQRAARLAGSRLTADGVIVITASDTRSQARNREAAVQRLLELLRAAAPNPKTRRPTRPTLGAKTRRLATKTRRGAIKSLRSSKPPLE